MHTQTSTYTQTKTPVSQHSHKEQLTQADITIMHICPFKNITVWREFGTHLVHWLHWDASHFSALNHLTTFRSLGFTPLPDISTPEETHQYACIKNMLHFHPGKKASKTRPQQQQQKRQQPSPQCGVSIF